MADLFWGVQSLGAALGWPGEGIHWLLPLRSGSETAVAEVVGLEEASFEGPGSGGSVVEESRPEKAQSETAGLEATGSENSLQQGSLPVSNRIEGTCLRATLAAEA